MISEWIEEERNKVMEKKKQRPAKSTGGGAPSQLARRGFWQIRNRTKTPLQVWEEREREVENGGKRRGMGRVTGIYSAWSHWIHKSGSGLSI